MTLPKTEPLSNEPVTGHHIACFLKVWYNERNNGIYDMPTFRIPIFCISRFHATVVS
jgi:hypothetical protein